MHDFNAKLWALDMDAVDQTAALETAWRGAERVRAGADVRNRCTVDELRDRERTLLAAIDAAITDERLATHTRNYLITVRSRVEDATDPLDQTS